MPKECSKRGEAREELQKLFQDVAEILKENPSLKEESINIFEEAAETKVLRGIIPICANCKKFETKMEIGVKSKAIFKIVPK